MKKKNLFITQNNELISFALIILPVFGIFLLLSNNISVQRTGRTGRM